MFITRRARIAGTNVPLPSRKATPPEPCPLLLSFTFVTSSPVSGAGLYTVILARKGQCFPTVVRARAHVNCSEDEKYEGV